MPFNSYLFIFMFLPVTIMGYFVLNRLRLYTYGTVFVCAMSLWFYGFYNPRHLIIMLFSLLVNFMLSRIIGNFKEDKKKKGVLVLAILFNIGLIFYFKYYNFFVENVNIIFHNSFRLHQMILPLGISYFTFQQIAYQVDYYRGETDNYSFLEYLTFVLYFPKMSSGPLVRHQQFIPQLRDQEKKKVSYENLSLGLFIFSCGLVKKVLIADTFGKAAGWGFSNIELMSSMDAILVSLCYTFQLYFDFSGYSDMALGVSRMMNIELPQNFNSPYKATSMIDFWDRWHMSLTGFLREYVYFPLGGSRKGRARTYVNIMVVFLVSGIWHGANWTFIVWGLLNGVFNCLTRMFKDMWEKIPKMIRWFTTFLTVNFLWVVFRAKDLEEAKCFISKMLSVNGFSISKELKECLLFEETEIIGRFVPERLFVHISNLNFMLLFAAVFMIVLFGKNSSEIAYEKTLKRVILTVFFLCWSIISLSGVSQFLYVNF